MLLKNINRPIIFCIDNNYSQHLAVALESLFLNNQYVLDIHIFHSELEIENSNRLDEVGIKYGQKITFYLIDNKIFNGYKENYHFTIAMYFRLLIPDLLSENYESAIYIDSDIVVNGDVSYLINLDLHDNYLAAIGNPNSKMAMQRLGLNDKKIYFDSGLLVFNLKLWRENSIHKKILEYIEKHPDDLIYPDNDALNIIINGDFLELSPVYSLQSNYIRNQDIDLSYFNKFGEINAIFNNPLIIQFAGGVKPWHYLSEDHYKDFYWKYLKQSPYKDFKYKDNTVKNMLVKHLFRTLKKIFRSN